MYLSTPQNLVHHIFHILLLVSLQNRKSRVLSKEGATQNWTPLIFPPEAFLIFSPPPNHPRPPPTPHPPPPNPPPPPPPPRWVRPLPDFSRRRLRAAALPGDPGGPGPARPAGAGLRLRLPGPVGQSGGGVQSWAWKQPISGFGWLYVASSSSCLCFFL